MESRGQVSAEFLLLILVVLIIFAGVTIPLLGSSINATSDISDTSDAKSAVVEIANAVNMVYANGPGAKRTVDVYIPQQTSLGLVGNDLGVNITMVDGSKKFVNATVDSKNLTFVPNSTLVKGYRKIMIHWIPGGNVIRITIS